MTIGSLFSGIGGLERGLELCGLGPVLWQCDSDPAARAVLEAHWPGVCRYSDVREVDATAQPVDILCGGFPCQPVSYAGLRRAQDDDRWLWPEFARVIGALGPRAVLVENVPGLRTAGLRDVLADLARLGFDAEWEAVWAADVGAPHLRERVFVLAHARGVGREEVRVVGVPVIRSRTRAARRSDPYRCGGADARLPACRNHIDQWHGPQPALRAGADDLPNRVALRLTGNACPPEQAALAYRLLSRRLAT